MRDHVRKIVTLTKECLEDAPFLIKIITFPYLNEATYTPECTTQTRPLFSHCECLIQLC